MKQLYYKTKLFFECLIFFILNFKIFKYQKVGFVDFYSQMRYFIVVDPHIKHIKALHQKTKLTDRKEIFELAKALHQDERKRRNH